MDDKKLEYLKKAQERQRIKFLSPENIEKRKKKALQYRQNAIEKQRKKQRQISQKRTFLNKFSSKMKKKHEEDIVFYREIWDSRPHICQNCGKFLGNNFEDKDGKIINVFRYAHIIPKSIYPYLRHYNKNILLLCLNCHTKMDNSPKEIIEKMPCYDKSYIQELKQLHKKLEKDKNNIYK